MPRHVWGGGCYCDCGPSYGCYCGEPTWTYHRSRDEAVEELEDYKAKLEDEIAELEKRIQLLKEKEEK
ncbi:MAG: hypothetical protein QW514_09380 [Thermoprotei archaeon]